LLGCLDGRVVFFFVWLRIAHDQILQVVDLQTQGL
jgi:hypothetical protein